LAAYIREGHRSKIIHLCFCCRKLEEEQIKFKVNRRKEKKLRTEINEIETRKFVEKMNETKINIFETSIKLISLWPG
jgi:hypothetical protein